MSQTTTPPVVQNSFVLGADGLPQFYPDAFKPVPAGAEKISATVRLLWTQNPNLLPLPLTLADGTTAIYAATPQTKPSAEAFWLLSTPAERALMGVARRTNLVIDLGLTHVSMVGYVDLTDPEAQQWLAANLAAQTITPDRLAYLLAGVPPTAAQLAASAAQIAAMQAPPAS